MIELGEFIRRFKNFDNQKNSLVLFFINPIIDERSNELAVALNLRDSLEAFIVWLEKSTSGSTSVILIPEEFRDGSIQEITFYINYYNELVRRMSPEDVESVTQIASIDVPKLIDV